MASVNSCAVLGPMSRPKQPVRKRKVRVRGHSTGQYSSLHAFVSMLPLLKSGSKCYKYAAMPIHCAAQVCAYKCSTAVLPWWAMPLMLCSRVTHSPPYKRHKEQACRHSTFQFCPSKHILTAVWRAGCNQPSGTHGQSWLQQPRVTGTVQQPTSSSKLRATTTSTGRTSCTPRSLANCRIFLQGCRGHMTQARHTLQTPRVTDPGAHSSK